MSNTETKDRLNIVTIGGGSGQFALLSSLRDMEGISITAIVSMMDSGGSTGRLRDELGVLPPGDILKCAVALSPHQKLARHIFQKRFTSDSRLKGHNAGNMLLSMLSRYTGSFASGVAALCEILDTKGAILPVTMDQVTLVAELTDGTRIFGEQAIDIPRGNQREKIRDVYLVPHHAGTISVHPPVLQAIADAKYVLLGPGDLFTSIIPNLIVPGVAEALRTTQAKLIYLLNIMTKYGETHHFKAADFLKSLEAYIGAQVHAIIYNDKRPSDDILAVYSQQKSEYVCLDRSNPYWLQRTLYAADLLDTDGSVVRHNSKKLAALLQTLFFNEVI